MKKLMWARILIAVLVLVLGITFNSKSEAYPNKNITIINPYGAGGGTDVIIRKLTSIMEKDIKQRILVVNKPGGSGATGSAEVAAAPADGYTLLVNDKALISSYYLGVAQVKWSDFESICRLDIASHVIVVPADSPYKTAKDLADAAKAAPSTLTVGVSGIGGMSHLVSEAFIAAAGAPIKVVGFDGGSDNKAAVTGSQVTCSGLQVAEVMPLVQSGDLRILGLAENERSSYLPDVPTFREQGFDCVLDQFRVIWAPKGTPKEVVDFLANAFKKAMDSDEFAQFLKMQFNRNGWLSPADTVKELERQDALLKQLVEAAGLLKQR